MSLSRLLSAGRLVGRTASLLKAGRDASDLIALQRRAGYMTDYPAIVPCVLHSRNRIFRKATNAINTQ